jgi:hypothetical protein
VATTILLRVGRRTESGWLLFARQSHRALNLEPGPARVRILRRRNFTCCR